MKRINIKVGKEIDAELVGNILDGDGFKAYEVGSTHGSFIKIELLDLEFSYSKLCGKYSEGIIPQAFYDIRDILTTTKEIKHSIKSGFISLDLSGLNINPYILGSILEEIGYEQEEDALEDFTNGWEHDFSIPYHLETTPYHLETTPYRLDTTDRNGAPTDNSGLPEEINIQGCLMTFELKLVF